MAVRRELRHVDPQMDAWLAAQFAGYEPSWQVRLRKALLLPFNCRWNGIVRDFTAWLEKPGLRRPF